MPPPAYYLGRPAHVYINAMTPKSRKQKSEIEAAKETKETEPNKMAAPAEAAARGPERKAA